MRTILVVLALAMVAAAAPGFEPIFRDYHEEFGIPEYERIKAFEEAQDFDGSRIAGGTHARLGQYPYMGGLIVHHAGGFSSVCGSSLLTNTRAVTAAHCWAHSTRSFTVVLGSIRLHSGGVRIDTNQIDFHPQYNPLNYNNDVAVIRIRHVNFNNHINRINLATGNNLYVGTHANAAGFGRKGDGVGIPHNQPLSHVRLQVISNAECARTFHHFIIPSTLCTSGAGGRSICIGDSGGPLAVGNTLIGITSFINGRGCTRGLPAGFARVTSFSSWIRSRL